MCKRLFFLLLLAANFFSLQAQDITITGIVVDERTKQPVEFAYVAIEETSLWAVTDGRGSFRMQKVPIGKVTLHVQCLGYATKQLAMNITKDIPQLRIVLKQANLQLNEVTVTAKRKTGQATTSYTIDRTALDNQQMINLADISTLLPGGKTVNPTLTDDSRMALRSGSSEKGYASFGTAVEVDGMRLGNNAAIGETAGVSTRTISTSNIESVEVITGIPSVEYGDLSNGVVKVNTRKGKSPFIVEGKINQHTRQIALNKGFDLGKSRGILNVSLEHARSFADAASPYKSYQRNILSLNYMNVFLPQTTPLTLNIGVTGNVGGYNAESDPDNDLQDYSKVRDNTVRAHFDLNWLLNKSWITNVSLQGALNYRDRRTEDYEHQSSASTQPSVHSTTEGYFMASNYDDNPSAPVILGPTGYWYVRSYNDSKPMDWSLRLKADWTHRFHTVLSRLKVGAEYTGSRNNGRGTYYEDMRYAENGWREYRYDQLPTLSNIALYAEEKISFPTTKRALFELTAGLRSDITLISGSDYGTVGSLSPRFNGRYIFWRGQFQQLVSELSIHAGWGKSVKLPSFQVLYPAPSYRDLQVFSSPSTSDNTSYYAYYTHLPKTLYNSNLRWQRTHQTDIGLEMNLHKIARISLSGYHNRTYNPYLGTTIYTPFSYLYTPQSALSGVTIPSSDRVYTIHPQSGQVTVSSRTSGASQVLTGNTRRSYLTSTQYVNASPLDRYGVEWVVDFQQIKALSTSLRLDGNYYYYKGLDDTMFSYVPSTNMTGTGEPYQYVGWYRGTNATTGSAVTSVSNGSLSRQLNLNATITTHIPKIRLIVALRLESTLYRYSRPLSELDGAVRGVVLADKADYTGTPYDGSSRNKYVAVYPEYYSTWDHPDERIPFAEKFLWAKTNDPTLYNDLCNLVVKSNQSYTMNPNRISSYYSANLSVTKEIGDHVSVSFYANNFFNLMKTVNSSQTDKEESLFGSGYIPSYYYGLSLRLKL